MVCKRKQTNSSRYRASFRDRPLRAFQSITPAHEMWLKLFERFASSSQHNKISALTTLLNKKPRNASDISDHVSQLESLFNRLETKENPIDEKMQVALLLVSVENNKAFDATIAAIKTMKEEDSSWNNVSARVIEEGSKSLTENKNVIDSESPRASIASIKTSQIVCNRCNIKGHTAAECRIPWDKIMERRKNKAPAKSEEDISQQPKARLAILICNQIQDNESKSTAIDSGASEHIAHREDSFINLISVPPISIQIADGKTISAKKKGALAV